MVRQPSRSGLEPYSGAVRRIDRSRPHGTQEHRLAAEDDFIGGQLRRCSLRRAISAGYWTARRRRRSTPPRAVRTGSLSEGAVIGGFTIDRLIGRGGMGRSMPRIAATGCSTSRWRSSCYVPNRLRTASCSTANAACSPGLSIRGLRG